MNKKYWRVWDTPIIWAGTYADNSTVAVSCTWLWEAFIRLWVAKDISDRMKYGKLDIVHATQETIQELMKLEKWLGWLISISKEWICVSRMTKPWWMIHWGINNKNKQISFFDEILLTQ